MIFSEQALTVVLDSVKNYGLDTVSIFDSVNRVLAQPVYADRDFPPFNRVAMDGVAIDSKGLLNSNLKFKIQATQGAGEEALSLKDSTYAIEIMTGAVLPCGCDLVVPYERLELREKTVVLDSDSWAPWKNIHRQGSDQKKGNLLIEKGTLIRSSHISILATVGLTKVSVEALPKIAVVSTGDELVGIDLEPLPHQIRMSNSVFLQADLKHRYGVAADLFHLKDDFEYLNTKVSELLDLYDVLLFSGGVSMGKFDFLPKVFSLNSVEEHFYKVAQRPGKPLWFGAGENSVVFGFPGNPISTFTCYHYYFRKWLDRCLNISRKKQSAVLSETIEFKPDLDLFQLVSLNKSNGEIMASPIKGSGSGDLTVFSKAEGILVLNRGQEHYPTNTNYELIEI